ncbi:MAG: Hsp20 family protein [Rhodospirillales bacterium]|nr:Hsp20 family protein [Rhodospirillales bacterium]
MRMIDFSPLFRSTVGFDRMQSMLESAARTSSQDQGYPPYNIEALNEDAYRITMAVAGFSEKDLDITVNQNTLEVSGRLEKDDSKNAAYLFHGLASRDFKRSFKLADHIKVVNAALADGLLHIDLAREIPEEMKPRKIAISSGPAVKTLKQKAA